MARVPVHMQNVLLRAPPLMRRIYRGYEYALPRGVPIRELRMD